MNRLALLLAGLSAAPALADDFTYNAPGDLTEGSGTGRADDAVYAPGIRYPIEVAPSFLNSQVWGHGGMYGPGGSECDEENFTYPWSDNFCETRSWDTPMCPAGEGHQGQDMRAASCADQTYWAVAAEDGVISYIGSYSLYFVGDDSDTEYAYLHMEPTSITVDVGDHVTRGQRLGLVSDAFGESSTTTHLHFELHQVIEGLGDTPVPPYTSLVAAYEDLLDLPHVPCQLISAEGGVLDDAGPCLTLYGPAATWRLVTGSGYEDQLRWTYAWTSANPGNWAKWNLELEEAGSYELAIHITPAYAQSQQVPMTVAHGGGESELVVDLTEGNGWLVLGEFEFAAGDQQSLSIFDNTGEALSAQRKIDVDAVRLVRLDLPPGDDGGPAGGDSDEPVDGGDPTPADVDEPDGGDPGESDPDPDPDPDHSGPGAKQDDDRGNSPRGGLPGCAGAEGTMLVPLAALFAYVVRRRRRQGVTSG